MHILLRLELNHLSIEAKQDILKPLNLMHFKYSKYSFITLSKIEVKVEWQKI